MIFQELHIDGFGIFNDFSLTRLEKGINLIVGNNEVGKTTLLKFLRFTLFGYPRFRDQRMPPLYGGNHGGRIKAHLSSGKEALFERSGDDDIRLLYDGKESQNQSQWVQLLGNASRELYAKVYAFSLDELVDLGALTESGVEDKLFSIGLGLGDISLNEVEKNIAAGIDRIYIKGGRKGDRIIPSILERIKNRKEALQNIQDKLPRYQELTLNIKNLEEECAELDRERERLRNDKETLEIYLKCYKSFVVICGAEEELQKLPELRDYPEKGPEQLDKLEEKEAELEDSIRGLQSGTEEEKGIAELEEAIKKISYNEQLLERAEGIEYLRQNLANYRQTIADKNDDEESIDKYNHTIQHNLAKISSRWSEANIIGFSDSIAHQTRIEEFNKELEKIEKNRIEQEAQLKPIHAESALNVINIARGLALIFGICALPAFYYGLHFLGGALLLIAALLFFGKRYILKESSDQQIRQQLEELVIEERKIKTEYERYLEEKLRLPPDLSIKATLEIFQTIDNTREKIEVREKLDDKLKSQRLPFIREYEQEVSALSEILPDSKQDDNTELMVNRIIEEFDDSRSQAQSKAKLQEELARKRKILAATQTQQQENSKKIQDLLESIGAADRTDFRKRYAENDRVGELIKKKREAVQTIETIAGLNRSGEVSEYLKSNQKENIESEIAKLSREIESKAQEYRQKTGELGEQRNELKRVEGESELAEVMTELETERQRLRNAYKEWISGKMALKILADVKTTYEQEKQPAVIKNSGTYFKRITDKRYERLRVALDEKEVAVYDSKGVSKKIGQLSRGTREQLLISLRLGYIEEYEKGAESLPVIVDEVLVNFDPERARQTAQILREFGQDRQILIFTCHPETKDYFTQGAINLIQL